MRRRATTFFIALLVIMFLVPVAGHAQKQTESVQQIWFAYFNQSRLSDRWGLWFDGHIRTKEDFVTDLSTTIARAGLTYYLNDNTKLTAGYSYVTHYPLDEQQTVSQPEHRPWQQVQWHTKYSKIRMMQYVRLEERYRRKIANADELAEGYNFNWRVRYNFFITAPLSKKAYAPGTLSFVFNDELHINAGKEIVYNYFDQNRLFVGLSFHTNQNDNIQFGYMNQFQQLASGNKYKSVHVARIYYIQNLDFRRKR